VKYWEIIADRLSAAGWSWGCVATINSNGQTIFVADAHRDDGNRFVVGPMFSNTQDERRWYERRATAVRLIRLLGRNDPCQGRNVFRASEVSCLTEESNDRRHASHSLVVQPQVLSR